MKTASYSYGKKPIKADVTNLRETAKNTRRSTGFEQETVVLDPATGRAIVTARIYRPGSVAYCSVWIYGRGVKSSAGRYGRGQASAGGYGYHKASAALDGALNDAGVMLSQRISGVGDSAMLEALEAVARAVTGKRRFIVHNAHA